MCGIAGIVHCDGSSVDQGELDRVTDALAHRGPDGRGTYRNGPVGLGHRRLKIIDLSDAAAQPMTSEDGRYTLTFNGEIYNFREEREKLQRKGYTFRSQSDTEVLLALYREYGENCLQYLRGMFAFAVYDCKEQRLFCARDRLGKKPFKYFFDQKIFAFASELKALRQLSSCPSQVDEEALYHFLTMMYVPAPQTGVRGIQKLPAAHALTLNVVTGHLRIFRYWSLRYEPEEETSVGVWSERILSSLEEAVRLRLVADVPVGAFLSGGLDSAAVVAMMSKCSTQPVRTFSIGSNDPRFDELPDAQRIAEAFGTEHHPISLQADIVGLLPQLVSTYEEPFADSSAIPTYLVSRETRKDVTVVLNGDGGDENFAGYVRYPILLFSVWWAHMPSFVHGCTGHAVEACHHLCRNTLSYRCRRFQDSVRLPWSERYLQYLSFFTEEEKNSVYRNGHAFFSPTTQWYAERTEDARMRGGDLLHQAMSMDLETYLPDDLLPKVDLGSMAHGLEARSPLLDHVFLEMTAHIPSRLLRHGYWGKWIMRKTLEGVLPPTTIWKKKRGFRLPLNRWFRSDACEFVRSRLCEDSSPLWNFLNQKGVEQFLAEYFSSRIDYSDHIWSLLWLDEWLRQYTRSNE